MADAAGDTPHHSSVLAFKPGPLKGPGFIVTSTSHLRGTCCSSLLSESYALCHFYDCVLTMAFYLPQSPLTIKTLAQLQCKLPFALDLLPQRNLKSSHSHNKTLCTKVWVLCLGPSAH